ncbi:carboxylesterase family protein [Aspergillus sclerotioniger CBS 115572]|uniref:Carboxylesterase family protein n=1 Tax=Aspergillus sclerotioniger CBS 115572 TaxID=1450535 RepID=A0A317V5Z8_9EURO|nr:carboxylesterase family protein [Aspergillus sclerotioniger CBS 115572]PWY68959.1 carboxylesterase family protein [Aspergillus sclerotioniger CBS 115572]
MHPLRALLFSTLAFALNVNRTQASSLIHPTAKTLNGTYYGIHQPKWHQDYFMGIPYAQPPVRDNRFRPAQSLNTSWTGEKNATEPGYMCYGYGPTQTVLGEYVSEDCLTLNIYRASNVSASKGLLPVAVYIHGGLFKHGSGRDPRYNMTSLLQVAVQNDQEFIGVTLNYRLSYWGFMYGKEIANEGAANLGLRDQRLALRWVKENIEAFGGDPEKITIWGQEAGAYSVGLQLLAYGGRDDGLFRAAIMQSGSPMLMWPAVTVDEWQGLYDEFVSVTNCTGVSDTLACLRGVDAGVLSDVFGSDVTMLDHPNPVIDGDFIQELGAKELNAGHFVKVPLLLGTTRDEGTWSYYGVEGINTTEEFLKMVEYDGLNTSAAERITDLYPDDPAVGIPSTLEGRPGNDTGLGYQWKRSSAYNGDKVMHAGRRMASEAWARHGVDVYAYVYDVLFHAKWWEYGAQEQDDIAFVFHNVTLSESLSPTDQADQKKTFEPLSYLMSSMWISFVSTMSPNNIPINGTNIWPRYNVQNPEALVFDVNATQLCRIETDNYRSGAIAYWMDLFTTDGYPK